jgi:hypothetical protein
MTTKQMKWTAAGFAGGLLLVASGLPAAGARVAPALRATPRVPVVVELFTSEGCSSCPPADRLLTDLASDQPVPGAEILPLEEHVDYWNQLGWFDPFSLALFSARQSEYVERLFRGAGIYTPQAVVDGRSQMVGSDLPALRSAIAEAARRPKARVGLSLLGLVPAANAPRGASYTHISVQVPADVQLAGPADVMLAVTEDGLTEHVLGGENGGRELRHNGVVRSLVSVGSVSPGTPDLVITRPLTIASGWDRAHLHIVVFAQERLSRRILGAATIPVPGVPTGR